MAGTPRYKIYDVDKQYVAATVDSTLAAALVGSAGGSGWVVKLNGRIIWREGEESFPAAASFDEAAYVMNQRTNEHAAQARLRAMGGSR